METLIIMICIRMQIKHYMKLREVEEDSIVFTGSAAVNPKDCG